MDLTFSKQETAFRDEFRAWLGENPPDPRPTDGGEDAQHVGIVEAASASTLRTIEFNTSIVVGGSQRNGGVVARKIRDQARRFVIGYIATYQRPSA